MVWLEQRVAIVDVKLIVVDVVEEHIDAAEVVGGDVQLLSEESLFHIVGTEYLGEFKQQGAGAASRVVNLVYPLAVVADYTGKQFADLLRSVVFATALSSI